jgi:hypothetical protein
LFVHSPPPHRRRRIAKGVLSGRKVFTKTGGDARPADDDTEAMLQAAAPVSPPSVALSVATFVDELAAVLPALVPEARIVRLDSGLFFRRGVASAELVRRDDVSLVLTLRQRGDLLLRSVIPSTARGLNDLAADLVGYFCGAPLVTLALFPHRGERARLPVTRRRRIMPETPLIRVVSPERDEERSVTA